MNSLKKKVTVLTVVTIGGFQSPLSVLELRDITDRFSVCVENYRANSLGISIVRLGEGANLGKSLGQSLD